MKNIRGIWVLVFSFLISCSSNSHLETSGFEPASPYNTIISTNGNLVFDSLRINLLHDHCYISKNWKFAVVGIYDSINDYYNVRFINGRLKTRRNFKSKKYPTLMCLNNGAVIFQDCFNEFCLGSIVGEWTNNNKVIALDTSNFEGLNVNDIDNKRVIVSYSTGNSINANQLFYLINRRNKLFKIFVNEKACDSNFSLVKLSKYKIQLKYLVKIDSLKYSLSNCKLDSLYINLK